jgi:hypothetical protein
VWLRAIENAPVHSGYVQRFQQLNLVWCYSSMMTAMLFWSWDLAHVIYRDSSQTSWHFACPLPRIETKQANLCKLPVQELVRSVYPSCAVVGLTGPLGALLSSSSVRSSSAISSQKLKKMTGVVHTSKQFCCVPCRCSSGCACTNPTTDHSPPKQVCLFLGAHQTEMSISLCFQSII